MLSTETRRGGAASRSESRREVPARALVISTGALAVPVVAAAGGRQSDHELLLWLLALVPAFLLAYHRGWRGAALALAAGMGVLAVTEVALGRTGAPLDAPLLLGVVLAYITITLAVGLLAEMFHRDRERAERLALIDELTGIANRRYARVVLEQEFAAARRGRHLALVMFDLDQFKGYNDLHGHAAGDEALRVFASVLQQTTRQMNLSARYGGEEFISILSDTNADGALIFVERVRRCLEQASITHGGITFSAGIAMFSVGMTDPDELVAAADAAMYDAKDCGRDRTVVYGEDDNANVA